MLFHDKLNDKIWDVENDNKILPEVEAKLKEIASAFIEFLEIPEDAIIDKVITGSSASYNYNEYSDLDLHIIVDYDKIHDDCPLVEGYLGALKNTFNKEHDITIHGVPVELYAEKKDQGTVHNGLYSLQQGKWIDLPKKIEPTDNDAAVEAKFNEIKEMVDKCDDSEEADELLEKIYKMRKAGLAAAGEFGTENLAFKKLRNAGCMDKLRELKKEKIDKQLSLECYTLQERHKSEYLNNDNKQSALRQFSKFHQNLIEPLPTPYNGGRDLEAVLYYLGSSDGLEARIKTPVETVVFNKKNLHHLLEDNEEQRLQELPKIKYTLKKPNLIINTLESGVNKNNYIKAFGNEDLMKAQLVVVKIAKDGTFYVTTFRLKNRKFLDKLKEGQIIYDLSDTYANKDESLSYNNIINDNVEKIKSKVSENVVYLKDYKYKQEDLMEKFIAKMLKNDDYVTMVKAARMLLCFPKSYIEKNLDVQIDDKQYTEFKQDLKDLIKVSEESLDENLGEEKMKKPIKEAVAVGEKEFVVPFFYGFYESIYLQYDEDGYSLFNEPDKVPEEILDYCLEFQEFPDGMREEICEVYISVFDNYIEDTIKSWGESTFVELDSPKEYNYTTDRIFAKTNITEEIQKEIEDYLKNNKDAFMKYIKDKHSSRSGFTSFYSNDGEEWLNLEDWDHNELGSVLGFILLNENGDEIKHTLNYDTYEYCMGDGILYTNVDLDTVKDKFNFNVQPDSLEDLENYKYDKDTDTYIYQVNDPNQLKLDLKQESLKENKMNEAKMSDIKAALKGAKKVPVGHYKKGNEQTMVAHDSKGEHRLIISDTGYARLLDRVQPQRGVEKTFETVYKLAEAEETEKKKGQILGYNNGVATIIFEHPITDDYTLADFQNDRIDIIDNNKDFQNFETRLVPIRESEEKVESVIDIFDAEMKQAPCFETANGVMYLEPTEKTIKIGGLTNGGVIPSYEFDYDFSRSLDWNIHGMIEQVLEEEGYPEEDLDESAEKYFVADNNGNIAGHDLDETEDLTIYNTVPVSDEVPFDAEIKIFKPGTTEYQKLEKAAHILTQKLGRNVVVENTYFDHGQKWMWTTLLADSELNLGKIQILYPPEQRELLYGDFDRAIDAIVKDVLDEDVETFTNKVDNAQRDLDNLVQELSTKNLKESLDKLVNEAIDGLDGELND